MDRKPAPIEGYKRLKITASSIMGVKIDGFEVVAKLHDNGITAIYALEKGLSSKALKISLTQEADDLILHEEKVLRHLNHPGIVKLLDTTRIKGRPALILERLYGDLSERLPLSESAVRHVLKDVQKALKAVHDAGFAHLDLKPENIALNESNSPILIDFGLAKPLGSPLKSGSGSMEYMAPERQKSLVEVSPTLDLYALGITTFELLFDAFPEWDEASQSPIYIHPINRSIERQLNRWLQPVPERRIRQPDEITEPIVPMRKPSIDQTKHVEKPFISMRWLAIGTAAVLIIVAAIVFG